MADARFLQHAARFQKAEVVAELLKHQDEVNLQDKDKRSLLHYAAWFGNVDKIKQLRKKKDFLVNIVDKGDQTALHHAAFQGSVEAVRELLSIEDIEFNPRDKEGRTPLRLGIASPEVVEEFAKHDEVDVNAGDNEGKTPLHCAAQWNFHESIAALLKRKDVDVNATYATSGPYKAKWTPFQLAGWYGKGEAAGELLKAKNLQVDLTGRYDFNAMAAAIKAGYRDVAQAFLGKYVADYYNTRENAKNYKHFFGGLFGYSKEQKLAAARFLLSHFDDIDKLEKFKDYQSYAGPLSEGELGSVCTLLKK